MTDLPADSGILRTQSLRRGSGSWGAQSSAAGRYNTTNTLTINAGTGDDLVNITFDWNRKGIEGTVARVGISPDLFTTNASYVCSG